MKRRKTSSTSEEIVIDLASDNEERNPPVDPGDSCIICDRDIPDPQKLIKHLRNVHGLEVSKAKCGATCTFKPTSIETLRNHLKSTHNFDTTKRIFSFECCADFKKWREAEEKLINRKYFLYGRTQTKGTKKYYNLMCNTNKPITVTTKEGEQSRTKGEPEPQYDFVCPSEIQVIESIDGSITVEYFPEHFKGTCPPRNTYSYVEDQRLIVEQVNKREPIEEVLGDIPLQNDNGSSTACEEVANSDDDDFVVPDKRRGQDGESIDNWVSQFSILDKPDSPIAYYDSIHKTRNYLMVLIHSVQKIIFTFAHDEHIIYVKSKKGRPEIDFQLTAVYFICKNGDVFPISVSITRRVDYTSFYTLFQVIFHKYGTIRPRYFISDNSSQCYLAWRNVMGECPNRFICIFDLLGRLEQKLIQYQVSEDVMADVLEKLDSLIKEKDQDIFEVSLQNLIEEWKAAPTLALFASYFETQYANKCYEWAACFRLNLTRGYDIDRILHPLYEVLHTVHVISCRDVSESLNFLMTYIRDTCLLKLMKWDACFRRERIQMVNRGHEEATQVKAITTNGSQWVVHTNTRSYNVNKIDSNCDKTCQLSCTMCQVCVHEYTCECRDYVLGFNLCRHIHATRMLKCSGLRMKQKVDTDDKITKIQLMVYRERKEFSMIGFKGSAVSLAKSLPTELEDSELSETEYKAIVDTLEIIHKILSEKKKLVVSTYKG